MALFPTYRRNGLRPVKGEGAYLWDGEGKRYLDFTSGLGVCNLGHCHPAVSHAVHRQLDRLWHVSNLFDIPLQEQTAALLADQSGLNAVFFCNSGAEANEAAIKLARKYGHACGRDRPHILTFHSSFHGRTLATLTATGQEKVKTGFAPLPEGFVSVPFNDMEAVEEAAGDDTVAVMLELVQGEGGVRPADPDFVRELYQFCRRRGILFMVDEVQTGMGRTGTLFSFQQYGIRPDVVTLAKGLGNGFPVGAMLGTADLTGVFGPGSHASTFGGNLLAMAAASAVLAELTETDLLARAGETGILLTERLREGLAENPRVKEVRGRGLMLGIELTSPAEPLIRHCREQGLLVLTAGPGVIRLLPPLIITRNEAEQAADIIIQGLAKLEEVETDEGVPGVR